MWFYNLKANQHLIICDNNTLYVLYQFVKTINYFTNLNHEFMNIYNNYIAEQIKKIYINKNH